MLMECFQEIERRIYPLTVIHDRYGGTYSGGEFLAWNLDVEDIPEAINSDDATCMAFWSENADNRRNIGIGNTIEDAILDLYKKMSGMIFGGVYMNKQMYR